MRLKKRYPKRPVIFTQTKKRYSKKTVRKYLEFFNTNLNPKRDFNTKIELTGNTYSVQTETKVVVSRLLHILQPLDSCGLLLSSDVHLPM